MHIHGQKIYIYKININVIENYNRKFKYIGNILFLVFDKIEQKGPFCWSLNINRIVIAQKNNIPQKFVLFIFHSFKIHMF